MNTIFKAVISLLVTAFIPILESGLLFVLFMALVVLFPISGPGFGIGDLGEILLLLLAVSGMLLLGYLVSLMYTFLLGLPALLIGWYFRAIRWWTTLIIAFLIGAIPATLSLLSSPIGQPEGTPLWQSTDPTDLIFVLSSIPLFGLIGLSSGLVFWLLWRYWVQPDSPAGRPRQVEMKPSSVHE